MNDRVRRLFTTTLLASSLALAGCGTNASPGDSGSQASNPTEKPEATKKPTKPTAKPATKPTAKPSGGSKPPTNRAEPLGGENVTLPVDLDDLETYQHGRGIFKIDVPRSWSFSDESDGDQVIVSFSDPSKNGQLLVHIFEDGTPQSEDELADRLKDYLETVFGSEENFQFEEPVPQKDGSILVVWTSDQKLTTGKVATFTGNSFIEQREDLMAVLTLVAPKEQFKGLNDKINTVLNSYKLDPTAQAGAPDVDLGPGDQLTTPIDLSDLTEYTYATGIFSISAPESWKVEDTSTEDTNLVLFTDPSNNGTIVVHLFAEPDSQSEESLTARLETYLTTGFGQEENFSMDEPKVAKDGSIQIVWSVDQKLTTGGSAPFTGNSFIEQRDEVVSILTLIVAKEQFEDSKADIDTILGSYKLDPAVKVGKE